MMKKLVLVVGLSVVMLAACGENRTTKRWADTNDEKY